MNAHQSPYRPAITGPGNGILHRAIVSLPGHMTEHDQPVQERIVFFEVRGASGADLQLEKLLTAAWCIDATGWCERGYIYNVDSSRNLFDKAIGAEATGELRLLETGCGGDDGVGPDRVHCARAVNVDLFVTPRVALRLEDLLASVDDLYAAEPVRQKRL